MANQDEQNKVFRLNKFVAHSGICSRRKAADFIKQGMVTVNGNVVLEPYYQVQEDDKVCFKGKPIKIEEKKVYILMNKPKDTITTMKDERGRRTVWDLLRNKVKERIFPVGRLDRATTGLLLLTNDGDLAERLAHPRHEVKKVYHAVINGLHQLQGFEADEPLYTTTNKSRVDFKLGKPSLTLVETIKLFKKTSLVKCFPVTGRMHQIRAHLSYHEAPIIGDLAYGGLPVFLSELKRNYNIGRFEEERPMIDRVALHAHSIAFRKLDGEVVEAQAPYPKDISVLIKQLTKYN